MSKRGFELAFHWIFVMVAGALILAFFFSVANKQKTFSQQKLQLSLVADMESIFTGAIVSRGTAQKLPVPPQGMAFECTTGCDCNFRVKDAPWPFGDKSMFAPSLLKDQSMIVWSNEFKQPYRVTNFLYLTNPNIKYYLVYDKGDPKSKQLFDQITKKIPPLIEYADIQQIKMAEVLPEEYEHTKFILLHVDPPLILHNDFKKSSASAIKIDKDVQGIYFYQKERKKAELELERGGALGYSDLPMIYAAMFSADRTMYECSLKTAFRKLAYVSRLYAERAAELGEQAIAIGKEWCTYGYSGGDVCDNPSAIIALLCEQEKHGNSLSIKIDPTSLNRLGILKDQLDAANRNFIKQSCPEVF